MDDSSNTNWRSNSDENLLKLIAEFIKHNRIQQNITQAELAKQADISRSTLSLLENGESVNLLSLIKVLRVLDLLHIFETFEIKPVVSPLEIARKQKKEKKRVRSSIIDNKKSDW